MKATTGQIERKTQEAFGSSAASSSATSGRWASERNLPGFCKLQVGQVCAFFHVGHSQSITYSYVFKNVLHVRMAVGTPVAFSPFWNHCFSDCLEFHWSFFLFFLKDWTTKEPPLGWECKGGHNSFPYSDKSKHVCITNVELLPKEWCWESILRILILAIELMPCLVMHVTRLAYMPHPLCHIGPHSTVTIRIVRTFEEEMLMKT